MPLPLPIDTAGCDELWKASELTFTFNIEQSGELKGSRGWAWRPATDEVVRTVDGETLTFKRGAPEGDDQKRADAQFVNDWFWLIPHCHVSWASDVTVTDHGEMALPLGEGSGRKVTAAYAGDSGGYTPGDAYDLFVDTDGRVVAWHFRQGAQVEPSMTTSFADHRAFGPVTIAVDHRSPDGAFRLFFTDVAVR